MDNNDTKTVIKDKSILVVDDETDAKELFLTLINSVEGYRSFGAEDGEEALKVLENEKIDLVLLDIVMPKMDGIQTLDEIKKNPDKYGTPIVIMLTNLGGETAIKKAKELKADDFILKIETEPEELLAKIDEAFHKQETKLPVS